MINMSCFGKKVLGLCSSSAWFLIACSYRFIILRINPFWIQLCYFFSISFLGFGFLKAFKPRTRDSFSPRNLDLFFTSVSASTVSSMSTVEMEVFSNSQLVILTVLMFVGGEVFTSLVGLLFRKSQLRRKWISNVGLVSSVRSDTDGTYKMQTKQGDNENLDSRYEVKLHIQYTSSILDMKILKYNSFRFLGLVVLGYLLLLHFLGILLVLVYLASVKSARNVLETKGLNIFTFSLFTIVSTFASCGFVPTNENMMVFSKNSGLLLILIPQVLFGNTLFPSCLRFSIWFLGNFFKKVESNYLLKNTSKIGYLHLLPSLHSLFLVGTVFGFILVQFVLFCSLEWNSEALNGLNSFQKIIGVLFQTVNSRHTGETIVDLSAISPAILVLFIVMMYLPPYTAFLPIKDDTEIDGRSKRWRGKLLENIIFSQLSYLVIFVILICITERHKMKQDPLNFNVLNIVLEVISAYGNVGFTAGYSCKRQIHPDSICQDKWYGFSGRWSDEGRVILIMVMFFGRLKKFNMNGGRAWILL
ncbi:sodium transporter HKT1 [Ricinus communis]|uniref:HKT2 n=1 Tax=Ricinus communis TaxID=3988 RepID=A0A7T1AGW8_RICCO|nr:sodium transporter HKT1 [Ricinus communis]QPM65702.1 HKT2 [Ricinus communis]|eukprot:XP_015577806.1 sodium transporter HKT1 [Ricinus communis]